MAKRKISREEKKALHVRLANQSRLYQKGYEDYRPDVTFEERYPQHLNPQFENEVYYLKCGWNKADREWEEEDRRSRLPICPFCGSKMEEFYSGYYCEDQETCKHHTHKEDA